MGRKNRRQQKKARKARGVRKGVKALARPYITLMLSPRDLDEKTGRRLKMASDLVLDAVLAYAKKAEHDILGTCQPKSITELGVSLPTHYTRGTTTEMRWAIATAMQFQDEIGQFLASKQEIEQLIVRGEWKAAGDRLKVTEDTLGLSMWGVEIGFLIRQQEGGLEANRRALKSILEQADVNWSKVLCVFFSQKAENAISSEDYSESTMVFDPVPEEGASRARFRGYLKFRVDPYRYSGTGDLGFFLYMEEAHSVFDRYLMLRRVVLHLLGQREGLDDRTAGRMKALAMSVGDIEMVRALATSPRHECLANDLDAGLFTLIDHYTQADYSVATDEGGRLLAENPLRFEYYELTGKAIARTGRLELGVFQADSPGDRILRDVTVVSGRGADWPEAVRRLEKLAHQFDASRLGPLLHEFILDQTGGSQVAQERSRIRLAVGEITPRACLDFDKSHGAALMSVMVSRFPGNVAVQLFDWVLDCLRNGHYREPPSGLPPTRVLKYRAYVLERLDRYEDAIALYADIDGQGENDAIVAGGALRGRYRCLLKINRLSMCATELANVGVAKAHLVSGADVYDLLKRYPHKGKHKELKRNIAWPVLFAFAQYEKLQPPDSHRLYQVLDDFLTAWGVTRPSELRPQAASFSKPLLIYLLRNVCVLDVLDSFIWYDTQEEVEAERSLVCDWLSVLDEEHRIEYSAEQGALKQRATMRELAHQSARKKIYVDTDGILSSLPEAVWDRVNRSLAYSVLSSELREGLDIQKKLEEVGFSRDVASKAQITFVDEGFLLFRSIFEDLHQRFLHSVEYGLDSNLSQRVRHGTLAGAIRPIFESFHFVTHKNARGEYADNTYWLQRCMPGEREAIGAALCKTAAKVDETVEEVRNTWLQIRGNSNADRGFFDFDYSIRQIDDLYNRATAVASPVAYLTVVFEEFWARTEANLQAVREAITGRLGDMLSEALDRCEAAVSWHLEKDASAEFRTAVTNCKIQLNHSLKTIADWFYIDDTQWMPDFSIVGLIDSLVENINRFAGSGGLTLRKDISGVDLMRGAWFRPLWDLFFILFNNILRHSTLGSPTANLRVDHKVDQLVISVTNPLGTECDRAAILGALEAYRLRAPALASSRIVKGEGGSGFAKLHKIIRFDFRCVDYVIKPDLKDGTSFQVDIVMQLKGTKDEDISRR